MAKRTLIPTLALAALTIATLGGCSTAPDPEPSGSASASSNASVTVKPVETVYDECIDGSATILTSNTGKGEEFSLGDCANVSIVGAGNGGSSFAIGSVDLLVVEGDDVTASVADAKRIIVAGQRNSIRYGGSPEIVDDGEGNVLSAK